MQPCSLVSKPITSEHVNIGDLPTGFVPYRCLGISEIYMRPLHVGELSLIYFATSTKRHIDYIIRALNAVSNIDMSVLTEADFRFAMAWLRLASYPEAPTFVRWKCTQHVVEDANGDVDRFATEDDENFVECGHENNELVSNAQTRISSVDDDFDGLPEFADFPRMNTLQAYYDHIEEFPEDAELADIARHCAYGNTLKEKIRALDQLSVPQFMYLLKLRREWYGVYEILNLRCKRCNNRLPYRSNVNFKTYFAANTEKNILDIEYSLLTHFSLQPNPELPAKRFFYYNSCLAKDLKEADEKRRLAEAAAKNGAGKKGRRR